MLVLLKIILKNSEKFKKLKNVKFISKQKQENLKYFYNNSDIFVLYSLEEGLSMVQAQAMGVCQSSAVKIQEDQK